MNGDRGSFSVATRGSRMIIGRVFRGEKLRESLRRLAEEHDLRTAWVSAIGAFEWIDLTEYNQQTRGYEDVHRFERCELLSMQGNLSLRDGEPFWHLHATVSLREEGKDVTYGGHVDDGVVFALELRIECLDEITLVRSDDAPTGLQLWGEPQRENDTSSAAASTVAEPPGVWAEVVAASATAAPEPEVPKPAKGDWIDHAKFGLCKIEGLSGDGVTIIKLPDATRKKIKLDALRILPPRQDGPRTIFPVHRK